jgi:uncharacterized protein (DUF1697 family)
MWTVGVLAGHCANLSKLERVASGRACVAGGDALQGQGPSKLKTPKLATARNWNTVLKLAEAARR